MSRNSGRRRGISSWFVDPYRQVKLGLIFVGLNLFFSALFSLVVGYFFFDVYEVLASYFRLTADQGHQVLSKLELPMYIGFGLIVLFVISTVLVSVRYTHAIYGPLVAIHRFLDGLLGDGPSAPLVVRDRDELHDLAEKLNRLSGYVQSENLTENKVLHEVQLYLDSVLAGSSPNIKLGSTGELLKLSETLREIAILVKKGLN